MGSDIDAEEVEGDPIDDDFDTSYIHILELRGNLKEDRWKFVSDKNCCATQVLTDTVLSEDLLIWDAVGKVRVYLCFN